MGGTFTNASMEAFMKIMEAFGEVMENHTEVPCTEAFMEAFIEVEKLSRTLWRRLRTYLPREVLWKLPWKPPWKIKKM